MLPKNVASAECFGLYDQPDHRRINGRSATVAAGGQAAYVTVDPSGRFAYVANYTGNTVSVYTINQTTGALTAEYRWCPEQFTRVVVEPTGRFVDVVIYGADSTSRSSL